MGGAIMPHNLPQGFTVDKTAQAGLPQGFTIDSQDTTIGQDVLGGLEVAGTVLSSAIAEPIAGLSGIVATLLGDTGSGADTVKLVKDALTFEPKTKADQDKLSEALVKLSDEDPTFKIKVDEETGQTLISGMGDLHLEILVERMKREFKVEANVGKPQVAYRETITETVNSEGKFVKQSGGRGKYGHVWIELGPNEPGKGFEFENAIVGGKVPKE